jgi:hypothetical protein
MHLATTDLAGEVAGATEWIERQVNAKLRGRLQEFLVDEHDGQLVLHGKARSYHAKQLAQQEVLALTSQRILNRIEVVG